MGPRILSLHNRRITISVASNVVSVLNFGIVELVSELYFSACDPNFISIRDNGLLVVIVVNHIKGDVVEDIVYG